MKFKLLLSYEGSQFKGWQKQKHQRTVQGELEQALTDFFKEKISLVGAGRTDAGAHAFGQVAHFEHPSLKTVPDQLLQACNHLSPKDISVRGAWLVPPRFHARFSAIKKSYRYYILNSAVAPALGRNLVWWRPYSINLKQLQKMGQALVGKQDFKSFQNQGSPVKTTVKTIYSANWFLVNEHVYCFEITGTGFLKQMVRNLVGAQIKFMDKKNPVELMRGLLEEKKRSPVYTTSPSHGLYLTQVFYSQELDRSSKKL